MEADAHETLAQAARLIREARRITVLTGAGVSAESGVPTFRGSDGLWEGRRVEDVATPFAFQRQPELVWRFYHERRLNLRNAGPNPGHSALVDLERGPFSDGRFTLVTQNVDGLHRLAGSQRLLEVHGNIRRTRCTGCRRIEDCGLEPLPDVPHCRFCTALLRPDIVWFHEMLPEDVWDQAAIASVSCDVFLVVGTCAVVYPAAGLAIAAKSAGARIIEVNRERTDASAISDVCLRGPSGVLLPLLWERLRKSE